MQTHTEIDNNYLYHIGPNHDELILNANANEIIPTTVVVDPQLVDQWLKRVKHHKYQSFTKKLTEYIIDYPGLVPINDQSIEIEVHKTIVTVPLRNIEDVCTDLVDIYESKTHGSLRTLRLFNHNLLVLPETGTDIIKKLTPYIKTDNKAKEEFIGRLKSINHPNLKLF